MAALTPFTNIGSLNHKIVAMENQYHLTFPTTSPTALVYVNFPFFPNISHALMFTLGHVKTRFQAKAHRPEISNLRTKGLCSKRREAFFLSFRWCITSRTPLFYRSYLNWTPAPWNSSYENEQGGTNEMLIGME